MEDQKRNDAGNESSQAAAAAEWRAAEQRWDEREKLLGCDPYTPVRHDTRGVLDWLAYKGLLGKNPKIKAMTHVVDGVLKKAGIMRDSHTPTDLGRSYGISNDPQRPFSGHAIKPILIVLNQLGLIKEDPEKIARTTPKKAPSKTEEHKQPPVQRYVSKEQRIYDALKGGPMALKSIVSHLFKMGFLSDVQAERPSSNEQSEGMIRENILNKLEQDELASSRTWVDRGCVRVSYSPTPQGSKRGILQSFDYEGELAFNRPGKKLLIALLTEMDLIVDPDLELFNRPTRREEERRKFEEAERKLEKKWDEFQKLGGDLSGFTQFTIPDRSAASNGALAVFLPELLHELARRGFLDGDEEKLSRISEEAFSGYIESQYYHLKEEYEQSHSFDARPYIMRLWEMGLLNSDPTRELKRRAAEKLVALEGEWREFEEQLKEDGKVPDDFPDFEGDFEKVAEQLVEKGWIKNDHFNARYTSVRHFTASICALLNGQRIDREWFGDSAGPDSVIPADLGQEFGIIVGSDGSLALTKRGVRLLFALLNHRGVLNKDPDAELEKREVNRKWSEIKKLEGNFSGFNEFRCVGSDDEVFSALLHELAKRGFLENDETKLSRIYEELFSGCSLSDKKSSYFGGYDMRFCIVKLWEMGLLNPDPEGELRRRDVEELEKKRLELLEIEEEWQKIEKQLKEDGKTRDDSYDLEGDFEVVTEALIDKGWLDESRTSSDIFHAIYNSFRFTSFLDEDAALDVGREFGVIGRQGGKPVFTKRGAQLLLALLNQRGLLNMDPIAELEKREAARREAERIEAERREAERRAREQAEAERREAERRAREQAEAERQQRIEDIKNIIRIQGIRKLYHFTKAKNLESIFAYGILSRAALWNKGIHAAINDEDRYDGHMDGISVSISWVNYRMLNILRLNAAADDPGDRYVVLELDPSILYELDCAFYPTNAANKAMSRLSRARQMRSSALEELFIDMWGYDRHAQRTPASYTTDPQAEVLVFEPIPARYIRAVEFEDYAAGLPFLDVVPRGIDARPEQSAAGPRYDYDFWSKIPADRSGLPGNPDWA